MRFLSDSGRDFLANNDSYGIAHLISLQLPGNAGQVFFTDYKRDIKIGDTVFESGRVKQVGDVRQTQRLTSYNLSIVVTGLIQEELDRVLQSTQYSGQDITIERIFLDDNDRIVPMTDDRPQITYFEGEIVSIGIRDSVNVGGNSTSDITWTVSSKINNFNRVNGRITDDASHRGLVSVGGEFVPSGSAKKLEYQNDKGFFHSNQSINVLATYQSRERRYRLVSKRASGVQGWLGARKYSTQEYWANVTREVQMDINLTARYIPVIYGVQRTGAIPVFVDTDANDPSQVWAVFVFCEGEIDGFLDFYIDDQPIICSGTGDETRRTCLGNKRGRGDTLSIATTIADPDSPIPAPIEVDSTAPTIDRAPYTFNDGNGDIRFWVYHGSTDQEADPNLVAKAAEGSFRLQQDQNAGPEYWDENFRLADTAYVVMNIELTEERPNLPSIEAEIQGKKVRIFNPDGTFDQSRTSLNFAWQTLDYVTDPVYGAGLPLENVPVTSVIEAANLLDAIDESYDADWVPYWRYLGWPERNNDQRHIMQGSATLDTSSEIFKNLDGLLQQFDASLNPINGQYELSVEALKDPIADIHVDQVVSGSFTLQDTTSRNKFNSIQASISDPANGWNTTSVTFFNSQFLEEDNNIENKGNVPFPYITNYYTARSRAERLLKRARLTKEIQFTVTPEFLELAPTDTLTFTHPRYGWINKLFVVRDTRVNSRGQSTITAVEYERDTFINSGQSDNSNDQDNPPPVDVLPPRNLRYEPEAMGSDDVGLQGFLVWEPPGSTRISHYSIRRTGSLDIVNVNSNELQDDGTYRYPVRNLEAGNYTFEVRSVNAVSRVSSPVTLTVDIDPSLNLPQVENFRITNETTNNGEVFAGNSLNMAWDAAPLLVADQEFQLEIRLPDETVIRSVRIPLDQLTFSYALDLNKSDYATFNLNALGIYRSLQPRIRLVGSGGAASVNWAEL